MSSNLKPITLFYHAAGPNPWKVALILNELSLPYTLHDIDISLFHTPVFEKYNPNGRVPAIIDPNNADLVLWESGAIIEYLIDEYDVSNKISFKEKKEKYESKQWLHFQMSGQGPYFGQAVWFQRYATTQIPEAIDRYKNEAKRVTKVRDDYLRDGGREWLVGGKCTYADIAFIPWDNGLSQFIFSEGEVDWEKEFPDFSAWRQRLLARPAVKKTLAEREAAIAATQKA